MTTKGKILGEIGEDNWNFNHKPHVASGGQRKSWLQTTDDEKGPNNSGGTGGKFHKIQLCFSSPATAYDGLLTVLNINNNKPGLLTKIVDTCAGADKIFGVFRKRTPLPETNEEAQNVSQEAGGNNSSGEADEGGNAASIYVGTGFSELEQMQKQKTFTRSEIQLPTTMENLPADLLINIFLRLLAKQLAQMRCVSKYWNALLSETSFVKSHLHHSIHNNDRILLAFYYRLDSKELFKAFPYQSSHIELNNFIDLPQVKSIFGHTTRVIEVVGSVHGLICSCYGDSVIHIWNPSLSVVLTLPPCSKSSFLRRLISFRFGYHRETNLRFRYDPSTDDYKVVKLTFLYGPPSVLPSLSQQVVKECLQVEVYSMREGSWKFITQRFPSHVKMFFDLDLLCVDGHDGHLHWICYIDEEKKLETIVAFDLVSETFREIPFPVYLQESKHLNPIGVLDGKLCVMSWVVTDGICEVWVMDEYGVAESWVKCHVFSQLSDDIGSFGFTSHNEFVIQKEEHGHHLLLYSPIAKKAIIMEKFCHGSYPADRIIEYVDSLVWVAPHKR